MEFRVSLLSIIILVLQSVVDSKYQNNQYKKVNDDEFASLYQEIKTMESSYKNVNNDRRSILNHMESDYKEISKDDLLAKMYEKSLDGLKRKKEEHEASDRLNERTMAKPESCPSKVSGLSLFWVVIIL